MKKMWSIERLWKKISKRKVLYVIGSCNSGAPELVDDIKSILKNNKTKFDVFFTSDDANIDKVFKIKHLKGVVLMSEMRHHEMENGRGMSYLTYKSTLPSIIKSNCNDKNIPGLEIQEIYKDGGSDDQKNDIKNWLKQFLTK